MDTQSLLYFIEATKDLNFTKTANRLFISQQNLSAHISRLEQYYGVSLFDRKPRLALTYSGKALLKFSEQYKLEEDNLRDQLADINAKEQGQLNIGCSPHRTGIAIPILAEKFSQRYPKVQLSFRCYPSHILFNMLLAGDLDFAIAVDKFNHPLIESTPLFDDSIYLMVSKNLLQKYYGDKSKELAVCPVDGIQLKDYMDLPFVNIESAKLIKDVFYHCGCEPYFSVTVTQPQYSLTGIYENIAAWIITKTVYLHLRNRVSSDVLFLRVNTPPTLPLHAISFVQNKQKYLSAYARHFESITRDYFQQLLNAAK